MAGAGLFELMPRMLADSLARYRWGQSFSQVEKSSDQVQEIADRLLCICADVVGLPGLGRQLMESCGDVILDGYNAWAAVDSYAQQTQGSAAGATPPEGRQAQGQAQGQAQEGEGREEAPEAATVSHPRWEIVGEDEEDRSEAFGIPPQIAENFCRFWANGLRWLGDPAEQDRLVGKGLVGKLRQAPGSLLSGRPVVLSALEPAFQRRTQQEIRESAREAQQHAAVGKTFRQQGNEAFGAGEYKAAVEMYDRGIAETPADPLLHGNKSLALLRMERYEE